MVRGWAKLCTSLMGNVWLITWRSFANRAYAIQLWPEYAHLLKL